MRTRIPALQPLERALLVYHPHRLVGGLANSDGALYGRATHDAKAEHLHSRSSSFTPSPPPPSSLSLSLSLSLLRAITPLLARHASALQSNCGGYESILWDAGSGKIIRSVHDTTDADTAWHTWTCILGFPVMGIWPPASDGTDINAVHRTRDGKYVVTADDNGLVKLFNCPAVVHDAPHRAYRAHASHVMNCRFLKEDTHCVTVGGGDRAVIQWKLISADVRDHEDVFHSDREIFDPLGNRRHWKGSKPWV